MGRTPKYDLADLRLRLFDALVAAPDGLDIRQIADALDLDLNESTDWNYTYVAIRTLRLELGKVNADPDERVHGYTIPIRHDGRRQVYFLSANRTDGLEWQGTRADTVLSRLQVDLAHWQSLASITDGRTVEGKIARAHLRHFTRLSEDLTDIRAGL